MQTVTISGTSWVTYVAYSTTVNTTTTKEMVSIYCQGGVYKNFAINRWEKQTVVARDGTTEKIYHHKFKIPENYCASTPFDLHAVMEPANNSAGIVERRIYSPSECGRSVAYCVDQFYNGQGWLSVGLQLANILDPGVMVRAIRVVC